MLGHRQTVAAGAALGLLAGLLIGAGAALAQGPHGSEPSPAPGSDVTVGAAVAGTPATGPTVVGTATSPAETGSGGAAAAGAAIAYPYFGGTPGVAPDNTIVVTGAGQADMKSDGSDRAAAQKTALAAALTDAKAQADAIAKGTGLTITGVLSVSASVSPYGVVMPMVAVPDSGSNAPGSTSGAPVPAPVPPEVGPQTLVVSVTVAYRVG